MKRALVTLAVVLSGCGGTVKPELYALVVNFFTVPDSCYEDNKQPASGVTAAPPARLTVEVFDGPDGTAYLDVAEGSQTIDMGDAPSVQVAGIFTGKKADSGWKFTADASGKQQLVFGNNVITSSTHAELTFPRGMPTFKGTGALSSAQTCAGSNCPDSLPSCNVSGLTFDGTRLDVEFLATP